VTLNSNYFHSSILFCLFILLLSPNISRARKPAVEDFVGIEYANPTPGPQGTEALFDFSQGVEKNKKNNSNQIGLRKKSVEPSNVVKLPLPVSSGEAKNSAHLLSEQGKSLSPWFIVAFIFAMPSFIWGFMQHKLEVKKQERTLVLISSLKSQKAALENKNPKTEDQKFDKAS
jgi:hypothetical protein